jgi:hypothetical protein
VCLRLVKALALEADRVNELLVFRV